MAKHRILFIQGCLAGEGAKFDNELLSLVLYRVHTTCQAQYMTKTELKNSVHFALCTATRDD